jgi:hypothetical protein
VVVLVALAAEYVKADIVLLTIETRLVVLVADKFFVA